MKECEFKFFKVADTPDTFDIEKFKCGDIEQAKLYKNSKTVYHKTLVKYEDIPKEDSPNFAREVPEGCMFIDYDDIKKAKEIYEMIIHSKVRCRILETQHGYQFLFRKPSFYKKELTGATNWFGYNFDAKGTAKGKTPPVQIIKVCGMLRKEIRSWNLDTPTTILDKIDIEELDILPFWLWGKSKDSELHKRGKTGDRTKDDAVDYTLKDNPFTALMKMKEGGRHNHIVERCSYFALSNGFEIDEFKSLIIAIHDQYLVKLGTPMPDTDLFGDLEERWEGYKATMTSSGWNYDKKERKWNKAKSKKEDKIDERRAAEYLYNEYDFYVRNPTTTGLYTELLYREIDGDYEYKKDLTKIRKKLKEYSDQNFRKKFFEEVEVQLMQMCAEDEKLIKRSHQYVLARNKVLNCFAPLDYEFSWLGKRPPTDVVLPWNCYSREWVEEHKEDLGGLLTKFIKDLSRNSKGIPQPEVEQWLWVVAGACMIPKNDLEKIVILRGGGNNGKSIYTSLIRLCLGEDMFNTSKIFDNSPQDSFWGKDFDKGICCIVDDLPKHYNKDTFSYLKGAITKSDTVEINEKFKPKRRFDEIPQIIASTNHDFKLSDKSDGMKRRVLILPTEFHIDDSVKDTDLQHKLVMNTTDTAKITEYKISEDASSKNGIQVMKLHTKEQCVLDSLKDGSLAWFANKARYEYFNALEKNFIIGDTTEMKELLGDTFKNTLEIQCKNFIKWYIDSKCGTDSSRDLSIANIHFKSLYPIYEPYCETEGIDKMKEGQFRIHCPKAITNLGYQITDKRDEKNQPYRYVVFCKEV